MINSKDLKFIFPKIHHLLVRYTYQNLEPKEESCTHLQRKNQTLDTIHVSS